VKRESSSPNCFESEAELGAGFSLFERSNPESTGADPVSELRLSQSRSETGLADEGADCGGIEELRHREMLTFINITSVLTFVNITHMLTFVNYIRAATLLQCSTTSTMLSVSSPQY
jgi:hypothetical protein